MAHEALVAKLVPKLVAILEARKAEIVQRAEKPLERWALQVAWPAIIREIPVLVESAVSLITEEFGPLNLDDLLTFLETHAT